MQALTSLLVVVPTPDHDLAAHRAASLAASHGARLHLFEPSDSSPTTAHRDLRSLAHDLARVHGLAEVAVLRQPWASLVEASADHDLLVVGTGPQGWRGLRWRAVRAHLARQARCPLLLARRPPALPYARALVPVDLSHRTVPMLRALNLLADGAQTHLMHMLSPDDTSLMRTVDVPEWVIRKHRAEQEALARTAMAQAHELAGLRGPAPELHVHPSTHLLEALLRLQQALRADLVVVAKRRASAMADMMFDSLALKLLTRATADVLLLPPACTAPRTDLAPALVGGPASIAKKSA